MARTVASITPEDRPRHPACATPTTLPLASARITGMQSAIMIEHTVPRRRATDRKSTRLNSSHLVISYAVFCLKKKTRHIDAPKQRDGRYVVDSGLHPRRMRQQRAS